MDPRPSGGGRERARPGAAAAVHGGAEGAHAGRRRRRRGEEVAATTDGRTDGRTRWTGGEERSSRYCNSSRRRGNTLRARAYQSRFVLSIITREHAAVFRRWFCSVLSPLTCSSSSCRSKPARPPRDPPACSNPRRIPSTRRSTAARPSRCPRRRSCSRISRRRWTTTRRTPPSARATRRRRRARRWRPPRRARLRAVQYERTSGCS